MGAGGSSGGSTEPGSAREEAERLVAAALAMARSATSGARDRAGPFGSLGQVISDVLDQVVPPAQPADPATTDPWSTATTEPTPASSPTNPDRPATDGPGPEVPGADDSPVGAGFATGDPECCVCPVCRSIAALRDPDPELTERLATGAGDFAAGVASLLRAFSALAGATGSRTGTPGSRTGATGGRAGAGSAASGAGSATRGGGSAAAVRDSEAPASSADPSSPGSDPAGGAVWREEVRTGHDSWPADEPDVWAAATRAEAGAQEPGPTAGPDRSTSAGTDAVRPAGPSGTGRPPVPASRIPDGPVTAGAAEQASPDQGA